MMGRVAMATLKRCSGVFAWRPYGSGQNSMSINEVQCDDGPQFADEVQGDF